MKILVINNTYNSPSMGGIRSRLLAKGLAEAGHAVTVLTSTAADALQGSIQGLTQVKVGMNPGGQRKEILTGGMPEKKATNERSAKTSDPIRKGGRWKNILNLWLMVPDKFILWVYPAVRAATRLIKADRFDVIYSTMPVRSNLLVGAMLSKKHHIPLVVEYRDLWTDSPYSHNSMPTGFHEALHRRLEYFVLKRADKITGVCKGIKQSLEAKTLPLRDQSVGLNYNFFDPACFSSVLPGKRNDVFTIVYVGALYGSRRPYVFFEGLRRFLDEANLKADQVRFECIGRSLGIGDVLAVVESLGLTDTVDFVGQVSHQEALQRLCDADAALIVQAEGDAIHIPGKLFEAMGAKTTILLVSEPCEVIDIVKECSAGVVCEHTAESVAEGIGTLYAQWGSGETWSFNEAAMNAYRLDKAVIRFEELLQSAIAVRK